MTVMAVFSKPLRGVWGVLMMGGKGGEVGRAVCMALRKVDRRVGDGARGEDVRRRKVDSCSTGGDGGDAARVEEDDDFEFDIALALTDRCFLA
jgi:hypothetical protein